MSKFAPVSRSFSCFCQVSLLSNARCASEGDAQRGRKLLTENRRPRSVREPLNPRISQEPPVLVVDGVNEEFEDSTPRSPSGHSRASEAFVGRMTALEKP